MALENPVRPALLIVYLLILFSLPAAHAAHAAHAALPLSDVNFDGDVDGEDLTRFATNYAGDNAAADLDSNGSVDAADVARFAASMGYVETFADYYDVGPGMSYADPSEVPWESLAPGSLVRIHYRNTPYANKWVLAVSGNAEAPIVLRGIPQDGALPVIL